MGHKLSEIKLGLEFIFMAITTISVVTGWNGN